MAPPVIYYTPSLALGTDKATYTRDQINRTIARALIQLRSNYQLNDSGFPQAFSKSPVEGTHAHVQGPFFTFPIFESGTYTGDSVGPDRVVFGSVSKDYTSAVFVAVAADGAGPEGSGSGTGHALHAFADTSVNHARAQPNDFAGHEEAERSAPKPLVPTKEDTEAIELLTEKDVKFKFAG